jgi:hypothetical protein
VSTETVTVMLAGPDAATVVVDAAEDAVSVTTGPDQARVVATSSTGPTGEPGPAGPPGPTGPAGPAGGSNYVHDQLVPSGAWSVTHNLNRFPVAAITDSAGNVVVGDVRYDSANQMTVTFGSAFGGVAYLS